jgi:mycothiol synthase
MTRRTTSTESKPTPVPPPGVVVRPLTLDDAPAVAELIGARDMADFAQERHIGFTGEQLRAWWAPREERLAMNGWVALVDDRIAGYAEAQREGALANVADESCVHPEFRGRGIGSHLVALAEEWARTRDLPRLFIHVVTDEGRRLLEARGFELVRFFWRMEIELDGEPPRPEPPRGFAIRTYRPGDDDEALHAMHQEAFSEHWEFVAHPLENWLRWRTERSDYDHDLWQLAVREDGQVAGAALCFGEQGVGWVLDLAVGPRWRTRGLGLALLRAGFHELWRRGFTQVGLEVDSENETGATRLYERAGMRVTRRYATFEKQLAGLKRERPARRGPSSGAACC